MAKKERPVAKTTGLSMARPERFELPTTKFVAWYSIQLSYGRMKLFRVEPSMVSASSRHPCLLLTLGATVRRTVANAWHSTS